MHYCDLVILLYSMATHCEVYVCFWFCEINHGITVSFNGSHGAYRKSINQWPATGASNQAVIFIYTNCFIIFSLYVLRMFEMK